MKDPESSGPDVLWAEVARRYRELQTAQWRYIELVSDPTSTLRIGLRGGDAAAALQLIGAYPEDRVRPLAGDLLNVFASRHGGLPEGADRLIARFDRDWLDANLEAALAPFLPGPDDMWYLDVGHQIAKYAPTQMGWFLELVRASPDPLMREVAEELARFGDSGRDSTELGPSGDL